jgi:hypothetical protein
LRFAGAFFAVLRAVALRFAGAFFAVLRAVALRFAGAFRFAARAGPAGGTDSGSAVAAGSATGVGDSHGRGGSGELSPPPTGGLGGQLEDMDDSLP